MEKRNIFEVAEWCNNGIVNLFMEADGYEIYLDRIDGLQEFSHINEVHDEVLIVFQGELSIMIQGERINLRAGDIFQIPMGTLHEDIVGKDAIFLLFEKK